MASLMSTKRNKSNVRGRPAGSKNKSTILQEAIKGDFERSLKRNFRDIMAVLIEKAKEGDLSAIKLLFDKVVPNAAIEDKGKSKGDMVVNISISDMEGKVIKGEVVDDER